MLKKIIDKRNYIILFIIIILIIFIIVNESKKEKVRVHNFNYFNENITIQLYTNKEVKNIFDKIDKIYKKYHKFYLNPNNSDLLELLKYGVDLYEKSNGLIDITSYELLESVKNNEDFSFKTNIDKIDFSDKNTISNINIESIVGAYATDKVVNYLKKIKIDKYLINEDGNIVAGKHYNNGKYKISIMDDENKLVKIVSFENHALAVKGNVNIFKPYMVNPISSSKNAENKLVVVISDDINEANFLANTLYLMEKDEGVSFIEKYDAEALWYFNNEVFTTKNFGIYENV